MKPALFVVVVLPIPLIKQACLNSHACLSDVYDLAADLQAEPFVFVLAFFGGNAIAI
ncbi:hypothetical protein [uncultured Treponema sp.]|uniref:hypothetical protein n=1 Tax=uncultured Treponema sp. TaxID=162155 RepID=UPI0025CCB983|nr:hypothetical protein [uncultured Treponema sp.]